MMNRCLACAVAFFGLVSPAAPQAPSPKPPTWQVDPSFYLLGSLDASTDFPFGGPYEPLREPLVAGDFGVGLDFSREDSGGWLKGSFLGLARSPVSDYERTFFGAGRLEASKAVGANGRLTFTDEGKAQARPRVDIGDYWSNLASLRGEWNRASGGGLELEVDDRRRGLPDLPFLGFSEEIVGGGAFFPWGQKGRAHFGAAVEKYSAPTASGGRAVVQGELATFTRNGIATIRLAWLEPFSDSRHVPPPSSGEGNEPSEQYDFGDLGRAEFFETLAFRSAYEGIGGFSFLDPLESESDEWDFGRRKLVAAAFASRQLASHVTASAFLRYEHKDGPNLLLPAGVPGSGSFTDNRIEARASVSYKVRRSLTLLVQSSYLRNWSTEHPLQFRSFLLAAGAQIHF